MKGSTCKYNSNFRELITAIDHEPAGTAFITDENEKLCGIVTDGDFRRMLLKGKSMDDHLSKSDFGDFVVAKKGESMEALLKKTSKKIRIIPIVDDEGFLVDYFVYRHQTRFTPIAEPTLDNTEYRYLMDAFTSTWISSRGKYIDQFEENFSNFIGCKYGVAVSNGTVAIHLALEALGVGEGDEVIIPDLTFAATINAVLLAKATPVLVDVDLESWTISPDEIEKAINPNTKAIIPVHVYGQACDMEGIMDIAKKHDLKVIEDCAEAHGAEFKGKRVGSFGDIATFSFFANKIITTGEGGMCMTNSAELDDRMRQMRDHGMSREKKYWHEMIGFNYRMTNLQAAIGCAQLEKIDQLLERNDNFEKQYKEALDELGLIQWQKEIEGRRKVVWLVACLSDHKEAISNALRENSIDVRPFFYCLSDMPIYSKYHFSNKNAKLLSEKGMNLPTVENVDYGLIKKILSQI
ncbi:MAG: aminotransferase DegT [Flavobacteriales bacterium]|nr:aminotransferase DegT [Flavobacteriales bacterium]